MDYPFKYSPGRQEGSSDSDPSLQTTNSGPSIVYPFKQDAVYCLPDRMVDLQGFTVPCSMKGLSQGTGDLLTHFDL